ncbi:MAG: hypothetical protein II300_02785 [Bacteroidales bacterium]|nr:hypothetical protein [Bacteroidales bacterium]
MCNMCEYLNTYRREGGSIKARCAIKAENPNSEDSQVINQKYTEETGNWAMTNDECQFFYENQRRNKERLQQTYNDFITKCPRNR